MNKKTYIFALRDPDTVPLTLESVLLTSNRFDLQFNKDLIIEDKQYLEISIIEFINFLKFSSVSNDNKIFIFFLIFSKSF